MRKSASPQQEHAFTVLEITKRFKLSSVTVRKLIESGTFKARKIGSGKSSKWLVSARSVFAWLEGELLPPDGPDGLPPLIALTGPREIIALSSLPFMSAEERREIEQRRESGELIVTYINQLPALVPADTVEAA